MRNKSKYKVPVGESIKGFAYELISWGVKHQFIKGFVGETPEKILNKFDLVNSMIATNGKHVYVHEDWEKYEENKKLCIVNYSPYTFSRALKYSYIGPEQNRYELDEKCREQFFDNAIKFLFEYKKLEKEQEKLKYSMSLDFGPLGNIQRDIRNVLANKEFLSLGDIPFFMNLLGNVTHDYNFMNSSFLDHPQDAATVIFRQRAKELNENIAHS